MPPRIRLSGFTALRKQKPASFVNEEILVSPGGPSPGSFALRGLAASALRRFWVALARA